MAVLASCSVVLPRAIVHNGAFGWLKTDTDLYDDDTLHPSDPKGYKVIAQNIVNCLLGNGATNYKQFVIDCSVVTGLTGKLYFYIYDGILYIDRNLITTNFDETPAGNVITITDDFPVYFGFTNYIPVVSGRELAGWLDIHENTLKLHIGGDYITTNIYTVPTSEIIGF